MYVRMCAGMYVCMYVLMYVCMYVCMCVCLMYVRMHVYMSCTSHVLSKETCSFLLSTRMTVLCRRKDKRSTQYAAVPSQI